MCFYGKISVKGNKYLPHIVKFIHDFTITIFPGKNIYDLICLTKFFCLKKTKLLNITGKQILNDNR